MMLDHTEKIFDSEAMKSKFTSADAIEEISISSSSNGGGISNEKKCAICGTSKTPLWRSGPAGPKSLCNACGIRNKRNRRTVTGNRSEDKKTEQISVWANESEMIDKIARDVSNTLPFSISNDLQRDARIRTKKNRYSTGMAFLVVINLLLEVVSAVADQLSSIRKPYFARISLVTAILSVILSILELTFKIRIHEARFRWKQPMPWFYYPSRNYNRIFGSFTDTVLIFCVFGQLIVSTINFSFTERGQDGPIKVSVWPLFFAIGMAGSKFMEKPLISKEN